MGPKKYATAAVFRREPRFSDKIICNYFKVFTQVIASAKDDKAKQVFPREWDLAYIALPMVCQREQHRPTLEPEESSPFSPSASVPLPDGRRSSGRNGNPNQRTARACNREAHLRGLLDNQYPPATRQVVRHRIDPENRRRFPGH